MLRLQRPRVCTIETAQICGQLVSWRGKTGNDVKYQKHNKLYERLISLETSGISIVWRLQHEMKSLWCSMLALWTSSSSSLAHSLSLSLLPQQTLNSSPPVGQLSHHVPSLICLFFRLCFATDKISSCFLACGSSFVSLRLTCCRFSPSLLISLSFLSLFLFLYSFSSTLGIPWLSFALRHTGWHPTIHQWISCFYVLPPPSNAAVCPIHPSVVTPQSDRMAMCVITNDETTWALIFPTRVIFFCFSF